jgi:hypothetical protein
MFKEPVLVAHLLWIERCGFGLKGFQCCAESMWWLAKRSGGRRHGPTATAK